MEDDATQHAGDLRVDAADIPADDAGLGHGLGSAGAVIRGLLVFAVAGMIFTTE
jgi:hypothetical protein